MAFHVTPLTRANLLLGASSDASKDVIHYLGSECVQYENDGGKEWRFERLLERNLDYKVEKCGSEVIALGIVVGHHLRKGLHLFVASSQRRFGQREKLLSEPDVMRLVVIATSLTSAIVVVIIVCPQS